MDFRGKGDGKLPHYKGRKQINEYLEVMRFKSTIPAENWGKIQGELELFYKKKIYKMEQSRKDIRMVDIYFNRKSLPTYIKWREDFMELGPRLLARAIWER